MYRYLGNKSKLTDVIVDKVSQLVPSDAIVADLMSGTGTVANALAASGFRVISNDIMTYSYEHLVVLLQMDSAPSFNGLGLAYQEVLQYLNGLSGIEGMFFNEYSPEGVPANNFAPRKYFTSENAMKIDAIRNQMAIWEKQDRLTENEVILLRHNLILAVNDIANISGTYGYFLSKFSKSSMRPLVMEATEFNSYASLDNQVFQVPAEDLAKDIKADLVYLDPPYNKRQYATNYHILETLARGDYPELSGKSGYRNWWDQHSAFSTKSKVKAAFRQLLESIRTSQLLISYNEDGLLSIDELIELLEEYGTVSLDTISYNRFRSNDSKLPLVGNEFLISVRK